MTPPRAWTITAAASDGGDSPDGGEMLALTPGGAVQLWARQLDDWDDWDDCTLVVTATLGAESYQFEVTTEIKRVRSVRAVKP